MTKLAQSAFLAAILSLAFASAFTQTLTGTVTNGTTGKAAAGDEVILINIANGMDVAGSTKADSSGKFSFKLTDSAGPHLIRAVHQGVNYHQMAPPGTNSVDVQVYDVAAKVNGLSVTADVMRFQSGGGTLQGIRLFVVSNTSSPATTQMGDRNFEFYLPPGAKIEQLQARAPNGQPIPADAAPEAEKGRYAIAFPLRPGETQFQLEYTLPYTGEIKIDPKPLYPAEHVVVVLPKTMQFTAANGASFQSMQDPSQGDSNVEVAQQTKPGQALGFTLKGNGVITESPGETASGAAQQQEQMPPQGGDMRSNENRSSDNRPGGGLGAPIDAPDALQKYQWLILGGFGLLLALGGWMVTRRQPATAAAAVAASPAPSTPAAKSSTLLEALKEELFQLEVERKQGKIALADYERAKAALDQTLDRALKRQE
ncbi:MAG: carboxypeptidase regulatory-like domain-containing protein [Terriglobales bacterium]